MQNVENYDFFLFTQLWLEVNGPSDEPYDYLFPRLLKDFHRFEKSKWNTDSKPLYECILDYLKRPQYLGLACVTGHLPDTIDKYNALLEMLQPAGMLMQFERWLDEPQSYSLVRFIEANLKENDIALPY
jgi:hypothetical protein